MRRKSRFLLTSTHSFPSYSSTEIRNMMYNLMKYRNWIPNEHTPSQDFFYFHSQLVKDSQKGELDPYQVKKVLIVTPKK